MPVLKSDYFRSSTLSPSVGESSSLKLVFPLFTKILYHCKSFYVTVMHAILVIVGQYFSKIHTKVFARTLLIIDRSLFVIFFFPTLANTCHKGTSSSLVYIAISAKLVTLSDANTGIRRPGSSSVSTMRFALPRDTSLYSPGLPEIDSIVSILFLVYIVK